MESLINVGLLGLSQRVGRFNELGVRSWEESGCAEVERCLLAGKGAEVFFIHRPLVVRGGRSTIERLLREWADAPKVEARCDLILTVAGIGLAEDDIIPESTLAVVRRTTAGIADLVRFTCFQTGHLDMAIARGVAGTRKGTLIINLPGPDSAVIRDVLEILVPVLPGFVHAAKNNPTT